MTDKKPVLSATMLEHDTRSDVKILSTADYCGMIKVKKPSSKSTETIKSGDIFML